MANSKADSLGQYTMSFCNLHVILFDFYTVTVPEQTYMNLKTKQSECQVILDLHLPLCAPSSSVQTKIMDLSQSSV